MERPIGIEIIISSIILFGSLNFLQKLRKNFGIVPLAPTNNPITRLNSTDIEISNSDVKKSFEKCIREFPL